ncbi:tRNA adenosine deaminase-associated protein [Spongiactinospora sp. TRM90649]|uniref:tRNA adenosine deaminase-associated protein n=1 Tax=Spongiactinospora sp. TRM90649 TaxID=3031114 RepID=UPI0023F67629|nr:tRNA adenosine deaminase-associated protein [Spongiactinospora sp. TRM90649]MDF5756089.1 tRNA adenosine deaminase-associated protein [Spongiactinospora sp. TRM90649]
MTDEDALDFAIVVSREDDHWEAGMLPVALTSDLHGLIQALRQQPSMSGTIGLVAVGDEFFVALRVFGDRVNLFLSDITASWDWPLARQALDYLDVPVPDEAELDAILQDEEIALPAGDLSIFADLGLDEMELGALSGDFELLPDEVLSSIATRLGFSEPFERALDSVFG